jgi:hypothetical protein
VHTVIRLLRPEATHANRNGDIAYAPRPGRGKMDFDYEVVRLWERAAESLQEETVMTKTVHGVVHGKTIELDEDPGVAEGQQVQITIKSVSAKKPWGEGLRRCAGALANEWTDEDDRILEEIHQDRKRDTRKEIPE